MICPNCGKDNKYTNIKCEYCGKEFINDREYLQKLSSEQKQASQRNVKTNNTFVKIILFIMLMLFGFVIILAFINNNIDGELNEYKVNEDVFYHSDNTNNNKFIENAMSIITNMLVILFIVLMIYQSFVKVKKLLGKDNK